MNDQASASKSHLGNAAARASAASLKNEDMLESIAAEQLHIELVPGTEVMRDVGGIHFTHADSGRGPV